MPFIEAPTSFYLGRRYDPASGRLADDVVYYDARDLTTHAVVVGMTGSGKTGLCITLLEEAILDSIPAIIIDPKGDITNLLLTFPDLRPEDFQPWVNEDEARRAGLSVAAYAADVANRWRDGLESWGIVPDRVRLLKQIARYSIFTPGSDAGLPVNILASLAAPRDDWAANEEAHIEKINAIVTALLAMVGQSADPIQSKEHVLLSTIFQYAWQRRIDLTLEDLILQVQKPPFTKIGVFPVDEHLSERARQKLAMALNNIVAAPSFQSWIRGEPIDIQRLLYQPNGLPRVSVFYLAHLSEPERQFIITLLLENLLGWMRMQSGTPSLRALLYIDEMFGYFPPHPYNPPTKQPILRLLKQARAFGLGLILATQNPGDLDYKGLSNAGTWFIGRLLSENDRAKVMAGLQSLADAQSALNLREVGQLVADIAPRVFLMHNVHNAGGPLLVHTRWAMSYLRGPLTRMQIQALMAGQRQELAAQIVHQGGGAARSLPLPPMGGATGAQAAVVPPPPVPPEFAPPPDLPEFAPPAPPSFTQPSAPVSPVTQVTQPTGRAAPPGFAANPPPIASSVQQYYLAAAVSADQAVSLWSQQTRFAVTSYGGASLAYQPVLLAQAIVRYQDRKANVYTARVFSYRVPDIQAVGMVRWADFQSEPVDSRMLSAAPLGAAIYAELPPGLSDARRLTALRSELVDMLYNTGQLRIPFSPTLGLYGNPDDDASVFPAQARQLAHERRDAELDQLAARYDKILDQLEERYGRKSRELRAEKRELADRRREELFTKGEAVLSLLRGRTTYTLSRASRTSRLSRQTKEDLIESEEVLNELERAIQDNQARFEAEIQAVNQKWAKVAVEAQEYIITPFKKDIQVELFGIGWLPLYYAVVNNQPVLLPAG